MCSPPHGVAVIRKTHVRLSDLAGLNRLATDFTMELTDLAEALHNNIASSPGIRGTSMCKEARSPLRGGFTRAFVE